MTKTHQNLAKFALKIFLIIILVANLSYCSQDSTLDLLKNAQIAPNQITQKPTYYEPSDRGAYLGLSVGIIAVASFLAMGTLYVLPESVSNWNRADMKSGKIFKKYRRNVSNSPVVDKDELWLNFVAHPYVGAIYYLQPRMAGFSWAEGAIFSFVASTFYWEYGLESFAEVPSWQDLILTPALGALLGEGFYQLIRYIHRNDNELFGSWWAGKIVLWLLDPLGSLIQNTGLGELFDVYNKNAKAELITTPILPNGKGGVQVGFVIRF